MSDNDIFQIVQETLKEVKFALHDKILTSDMSFKEMEVDSLDKMDLFFRLEEKFNISFPNEEIAKMKAIGDVVSFIQNHAK
ncbi:MAG: acyl carrier protein [Alphaproteobacteria bacterium]|nr:acyl carrier protein [Alphaproteobacteria bacterium]